MTMKHDSQSVTELQKQILVAALPQTDQIITIRLAQASSGSPEVTIGEHRLFGEDAVATVAELVVEGLLDRKLTGTYVLTRQGINVARSLEGLEPLPINHLCSNCKTRLRSAHQRCPQCGMKVSAATAPGELVPEGEPKS
jgi:hypothetical protein